MPKFACLCGNILNLTSGGSDHELALIPERVIEDVAEKIEAGSLHSAEEFYAEVDLEKVAVYRCSNCGRIHVQTAQNVFDAYVKE